MSDVMLPPRQPEPVFNLPFVIILSCGCLLALHGLRQVLPSETDDWVIAQFAFVPARASIALGLVNHQLQLAAQHVPADTILALIGDGGGRWWSLLTYAFLHGSWMHVGFNCIWLAAFGSPVARRFGSMRFLLLMVVSAVVGALTQFAATPTSFAPVIGASAAVAGAMGAATRFVFHRAGSSGGRSVALSQRDRDDAVYRQPALSLRATLSTRGALIFVLVWFGSNLLFGLVPALSGMGDEPIAWQAHIGGFLSGLLLFPLFDREHPTELTTLATHESADLPLDMGT
jgi:membrane associated rhomboid family serine protease